MDKDTKTDFIRDGEVKSDSAALDKAVYTSNAKNSKKPKKKALDVLLERTTESEIHEMTQSAAEYAKSIMDSPNTAEDALDTNIRYMSGAMRSLFNDVSTMLKEGLPDVDERSIQFKAVAIKIAESLYNNSWFRQTLYELAETTRNLEPLHPYIIAELENNPAFHDYYSQLVTEYENLSKNGSISNLILYDYALYSVLEKIDADGTPLTELAGEILEAAKKRYAAQQAAQDYVISTTTPQKHIIPNNAIINWLQQQKKIGAGARDVTVINATKTRKEITAYIVANYDDVPTGIDISEKEGRSLSEYERQVHNSVVSLWVAAIEEGKKPIFTKDDIFRNMPGGSEKASELQRNLIEQAMENFRKLHIYANTTEAFQKMGIISEDEQYIFDEKLMNIRRHTITIKNGGAKTIGYEILSEPVMMTYSRLTNQYITVNPKYLAIEEVISDQPTGALIPMTVPRQEMTGYMLRRIAIIKHDYNSAKDKKRKYDAKRRRDKSIPDKPLSDFTEKSNLILFDTIFKEAGINTTDRKQMMINRKFCFNVLDYWKATNFIAGYKEQKKGRSITGIIILCEPEPESLPT